MNIENPTQKIEAGSFSNIEGSNKKPTPFSEALCQDVVFNAVEQLEN